MSVSNGQVADQDTFNNAFLSRTVDSDTIGVVGLANVANPDSGDPVVNTQRAINELFDADGTAGEGDTARKDYSSNNYVSAGSSRKEAIGQLDAALALLASYTFRAWNTVAITDGQSAADLTGETVDSTVYSSAVYEYEVIRGTTVIANGRLSLQCLNGTWRVETGSYEGDAHGLTFSVSQASTVAQLRAAADIGAGNGTIKLSKRLVPA